MCRVQLAANFHPGSGASQQLASGRQSGGLRLDEADVDL